MYQHVKDWSNILDLSYHYMAAILDFGRHFEIFTFFTVSSYFIRHISCLYNHLKDCYPYLLHYIAFSLNPYITLAAILDFPLLLKLLKGESSTPIWISLWGSQSWIISRETNYIRQNKVDPHGCQTIQQYMLVQDKRTRLSVEPCHWQHKSLYVQLTWPYDIHQMKTPFLQLKALSLKNVKHILLLLWP